MKQDPYRLIARWYDRLFEPINKGLRLLGLRLFLPKEDMAVLDVGCGTGLQLELYRKYRCTLHGIDSSPSMLEIAGSRLGAARNSTVAMRQKCPMRTGLSIW